MKMLPGVFAILLAAGIAPAHLLAVSNEHDVKAAFLINVLRLSQRHSAPSPPGDLTLCLIRAGAIEQPLRALENTLIRGRSLKVRPVRKNEIAGCEVAYFGESAGVEPILEQAQAHGILTIGSTSEFVSLSGMIALVIENRRIVVEVNQHALKRAEWVLSSHILEIARLTAGGRR